MNLIAQSVACGLISSRNGLKAIALLTTHWQSQSQIMPTSVTMALSLNQVFALTAVID
jgi:hypothetical protein